MTHHLQPVLRLEATARAAVPRQHTPSIMRALVLQREIEMARRGALKPEISPRTRTKP